ncbi:hypothetical protein [Streptomyces decoyicus]|uniref:hypothetical protein n=1 Tax=Streptomyces decoyicus TaxID=249567 RepID=UPI003866B89A
MLQVCLNGARTAADSAAATARELLTAVAGAAPGRPVLLHGEDGGAWPVLRLAGELGPATRIGIEDALLLPDGRPPATPNWWLLQRLW